MAEVAILGAGTMGHALALVFALGGHSVRLTDSRRETLDAAEGLIESALATLREAGEVDASWTEQRIGAAIRRTPTLEETVRGADVIVEAITERPDAKTSIFAQVDEIARVDAIIASNTSQLDVFPLIPQRRLRRALIAHWYTPPYIVDLVDIVPGPETDPAIVEEIRAMMEAMRLKPIVLKRFIPGYVANRIQAAISLEVFRLLDEGYASPQEIDDAVVHGLSLRIPVLGHLAKADFTGLELTQNALRNATYKPPTPTGRSKMVDDLVAQGRTGVVAGKGFFDWGGRNARELFQERDRKLIALKQAMRRIGRMEGT
jgi:3-hydroxybutyryl-CoA dehydrogenase